MIISIHQPSYLPWIGLMQKICLSETFIVLDEVQLADRSFQSRTQLLTNQGISKLLSIPIEKKGYRSKEISEILISDSKWQENHGNFVTNNYKNHPHFKTTMNELAPLFNVKSMKLLDVLLLSMQITMRLLEIDLKVIKQSDLDYDRSKRKSDLIIELLNAAGASCYISGTGAKDYQNELDFQKAGIKLRYQEFKHPIYSQKNTNEFIPGMSAIDLLMNLGAHESAKLLRTI